MEPADIDWKNIESSYIRDDTYEHFNAPKWLDLSAPDSPNPPDAWFCRPDCRHPVTHHDFLLPFDPKLKPLRSPLGQRKPNSQRDVNNANSLKRRGMMGALLPISSSPSSPLRDPVKNKINGNKFREDLQNQNPNLLVDCKLMKPAEKKEVIKSSADERGAEVEKEEEMNERAGGRKLRSTLSARNLFSGRDILGQISEFCHEIKKLAVGRDKNSAAKDLVRENEEKEVLKDPNLKGTDPKKKRLVVDVEKCKKGGVFKEVRAYPPTPQKFPSPLSNKPLKPLAPERGILQELEQGKEKKKAMAVEENNEGNNNNNRVAAVVSEEGSSMDMLWFFKPCTYLVK